MEKIVEIKEHIGVLKEGKKDGWRKELNYASWHGRPAKLDIREWDSEHEFMTRGITLAEDEAKALYEMLKNIFEKQEVQE